MCRQNLDEQKISFSISNVLYQWILNEGASHCPALIEMYIFT